MPKVAVVFAPGCEEVEGLTVIMYCVALVLMPKWLALKIGKSLVLIILN